MVEFKAGNIYLFLGAASPIVISVDSDLNSFWCEANSGQSNYRTCKDAGQSFIYEGSQ
jgi:hypothetical protein